MGWALVGLLDLLHGSGSAYMMYMYMLKAKKSIVAAARRSSSN